MKHEINNRVYVYQGGFTTIYGESVPSKISDNLCDTFEETLQGKYFELKEEHEEFLELHPTATPEEVCKLELSKELPHLERLNLLREVEEYDNSDNVNTFYINDIPVWFNKEFRANLRNSLTIEEEVGNTETILWIEARPYKVGIADLKKMLATIEIYAITCLNVTKTHVMKVLEMTLRSEAENYDITAGYPDKLKFNI